MRPRNPREKALAHFATALGVALIAVSLASGPLGRSPLLAQQSPTTPAEVVGPSQEMVQAGQAPHTDGTEPSFRGERPAAPATSDPFSASPAAASATATDAPAPAPSPVATTPPAATTSPTPTTPPAATATRQPTATTPPSPAPPAALRVGIQAGHWKNSELPAELAGLKGSTGAEGKGWREVDVNLDIARRVVALLQQANLQVDLIPATVPVKYGADAFVALHGDSNSSSLSGYKLARARWSSIPARDDALLAAMSQEYAAATGLNEHRATITTAMVAYYAFDRGLEHAVAATTPAVILEMGFLTNSVDRGLLMEQQDRVAGGIVKGILRFLGR